MLDEDDPDIGLVRLDADPYGGPFWDDEGALGDDFEELHRWIGISRELYDDIMAWYHELVSFEGEPDDGWTRRHFLGQQELLRRLATEVHVGIEIEAPRSEPRTRIRLSRLDVDPTSGVLVLRSEDAAAGAVKTLPPTTGALNGRVRAWIASAVDHDEATPDAVVFAWQDDGSALARELEQILGDDYQVDPH